MLQRASITIELKECANLGTVLSSIGGVDTHQASIDAIEQLSRIGSGSKVHLNPQNVARGAPSRPFTPAAHQVCVGILQATSAADPRAANQGAPHPAPADQTSAELKRGRCADTAIGPGVPAHSAGAVRT